MPTRRAMLSWISAAIATGIGAVVAALPTVFLTFPGRRRTVTGGEAPIDVGAIGALPEGVPVRVTVRARVLRDAWAALTDVTLGGAWLLRRGEHVSAWSTVCPHAGCAVDWDGERACFACPCHASRFGADGAVQSGPSPRALDRLEAEVRDGRVSLTWRRFRTGVSSMEPV